MAEWISPIYDRTEQDVSFAKQQIALWMQNSVGTASLTYPLKGCLNLHDLNRIENNIKYLGDLLTEYRYVSGISTKTWEQKGLPNISDIERILRNVSKMARAMPLDGNVPTVPGSMKKYTEINDIEKILFEIKAIVDNIQGCFQISDTFVSGQRRILPLQRR